MRDKIIILGSGPSRAILKKGKDRRLNTSALLRINNKNILIGITKYYKEQVKTKIDLAFLCHAHMDEIGGISKVKDKIKVYMEKQTWNHIKKRFKKINIKPVFVKHGDRIKINDTTVKPFRVIHSIQKGFPTLGYRFEFKNKRIVYASDFSSIPRKSEKYFRDLDLMIIDAAMWFNKKIKAHQNTDDALRLIKRFKPREAILTQIGRTYLRYEKAVRIIKKRSKELEIKEPVLGYDGLRKGL